MVEKIWDFVVNLFHEGLGKDVEFLNSILKYCDLTLLKTKEKKKKIPTSTCFGDTFLVEIECR